MGERGARLSGGQPKNWYSKSIIPKLQILILDEATNALDVKNEEVILKNIINNYKDITLIIISHRRSTQIMHKK